MSRGDDRAGFVSTSGQTGVFALRLIFSADLAFFLKGRAASVERVLNEKTSVKDAIESCGVPHPEVDLIIVQDAPVSFDHSLLREEEVAVYGVSARPELYPERRMQSRGINRFVADGHLGKLARDLRLLGLDVVYKGTAENRELLAIMQAEKRALLTRDRRLLMHSVVQQGYCPRSDHAEEQTREVLRRFELEQLLKPFTRCIRCNALLHVVSKSEIVEQLEPLTRRYYDDFRQCIECGHLYWRGSHAEKLDARIRRLRG